MYLNRRLKKYAFGDWINSNPNANQQTSQYNNNPNALNMQGYQGSDFGRANAQSTYDSTVGGVSSAGPVGGVIGMGIGVGNAIADPLREDALKTNSTTGGYDDLKKATTTEVVGGFVDPFKATMESVEDPNSKWYDTMGAALGWGGMQAGKVREENWALEEAFATEKQKRGALYDRQRQQNEFSNADKSDYIGLSNFAFGGGFMNNNKNSGGFRNYDGKSHENSKYGGIPVDKNGEPSITTGGEPVGLTEKNEVKYTFKDKNTYIFSDKF